MSGTLYLDRHGTKVGFSRGKITLRNEEGETQELPVHQIEQVVVLGHSHFSHDAIAAFLRERIPVIFSSLRGGCRGMLRPAEGRQIARRRRQLEGMAGAGSRLAVARALVQAKLRGHARLLRQWRLGASPGIAHGLMASHHCTDTAALRGHEGAAAREFFDGLRTHLADTRFEFAARRQHPSPDPVNALLSLVYTLLMNEVEVGVAVAGLDAAGGFYHEAADGRPALLMDLMEPLRPLADRLSGRLLRHELAPEDFETADGACRL